MSSAGHGAPPFAAEGSGTGALNFEHFLLMFKLMHVYIDVLSPRTAALFAQKAMSHDNWAWTTPTQAHHLSAALLRPSCADAWQVVSFVFVP